MYDSLVATAKRFGNGDLLVGLYYIKLNRHKFTAEQLSVFVGLIITNCIIMGRFEAYAMANKPWPYLLDGIGNGAGYAGLLLIVAAVRELFGSGSLYGFKIFGNAIPGSETGLYTMGYVNNNLVILPPMALIIVGIIIWVQRSRNKSLQESH
jgi:Na+-transporting NADH:ubiquinone oxidoreductase subunit D